MGDHVAQRKRVTCEEETAVYYICATQVFPQVGNNAQKVQKNPPQVNSSDMSVGSRSPVHLPGPGLAECGCFPFLMLCEGSSLRSAGWGLRAEAEHCCAQPPALQLPGRLWHLNYKRQPLSPSN